MTKEEEYFAIHAYTAVINVCILEIRTGGPFIKFNVIVDDFVLRPYPSIFSQYTTAHEHEFITVIRQSDLFMWAFEYRLRE